MKTRAQKKPRVITLRRLERLLACQDAQIVFKELFGQRMALTRANLRKYFKARPYDPSWAAIWLLTQKRFEEFERDWGAGLTALTKISCSPRAVKKRRDAQIKTVIKLLMQ